jgi:hypothetical protein
MGHASIEMTLKYAHLSPETKQNAVQVLDQPPPAPGLSELRQPDGNGTRKVT